MTTEYELDCATCGSSLTRAEIVADSLGFDEGTIEVAECSDCGGRYFPETTLNRLET
ncbi:zf-TFIIB domain-containing protein [Halorussus salilacus]|uniref:zf-TFIIB domain-containing protein n=1 Tax=Halorussus salilacus TaxID=2953750 RepID=UPI0020A009AE|nr:zf-TFIIB domain-containing protein [Halorussus salilacus]USZ67880.1 zf-TFIIB domain-containing protein [Halorussus salilacus]